MRSKKTIIIFTIICILIMPLKPKASAQTLRELYAEKAEIQQRIDEKKHEIQITEEEYKQKEQEIYDIEQEIEKLSEEIQEANKEIIELEKKIEEKKIETDNILVFLQLSNGEKSYLEYVFKAKSFTDFIHRVSVVEQLSKYNKEQINEMNELIKQNNELKKKNEETIKKQEAKKVEVRQKLKELGSKITELNKEALKPEDELKQKEMEIEAAEKAGCKMDDNLITCQGMITSTGFLRPLPYGRITSNYGYRIHPVTGKPQSTHTGIDIGGNAEGTPVYPVANGVVLYKMYRSSCGGNRLYIKHIVNGKEYTSLYMHLLSFADIQVGDVVRYDQVVGYVGGGPSTQTYDSCTTGAHLHLTMCHGWTTNHMAYMFNPREVIEFPALRGTFNGRAWKW